MVPTPEGPLVLMTLQTIAGSDDFGPVHWMTSRGRRSTCSFLQACRDAFSSIEQPLLGWHFDRFGRAPRESLAMSSAEFVILQLRESFATASRLTEELVFLRERLVKAEIKIQRLEEALELLNSENVLTSESVRMNASNTEITKSPRS